MNQKTYFVFSGAVFLLVAAAHLTRLIVDWDVTIGNWDVPQWVSIVGLILPGALSVWGFALASRDAAST